MTRVALMTVIREHNNGVPKFRVDTDGETENTTPLSLARKEWPVLTVVGATLVIK